MSTEDAVDQSSRPQEPPNKLRRLEADQQSPQITSFRSTLLPGADIRVAASPKAKPHRSPAIEPTDAPPSTFVASAPHEPAPHEPAPQVPVSPVQTQAVEATTTAPAGFTPPTLAPTVEEIPAKESDAAEVHAKEEQGEGNTEMVAEIKVEAALELNTELKAEAEAAAGEVGVKGDVEQVAEEGEEKEDVRATVQLLLMEAVEELSTVARNLERWLPFRPSIGVSDEQRARERLRYDEMSKKTKARVSDHLRKFMRKARKLIDTVGSTSLFDSANIPVDLIAHVDHYLSPNSWLRALYEEVEYINAIARGELNALGAFHSTLRVYMAVIDHLHEKKLIKIPKFEEANLPPTSLRSAIYRSQIQVDLMQVLGLVRTPVAPVALGGELQLRKRRKML